MCEKLFPVTNPRIVSRSRPGLRKLSLERLYHTRSVGAGLWSPDGKRLVYVSKPKTGASYEIHVMEFSTGRVRRITEGTPKEFSNHDPVWSPDGRRIAFTRNRADQKLDILFVADVRSGKVRRMTAEGAEHNYHAADWSPDSRRLLITA